MTTKPLLTYVLPTKDRLEWVGEAAQSILAQSVSDIELIIINDGSTDGTQEFLERWALKDPRVKLITHTESMGAGYSRNQGIKEAQADIVAQMDDDDIAVYERTEVTLEWFRRNPDSELVNFPYVRIDHLGDPIENFPGEAFDEKTFKDTGGVNYFSNPTCAFKKESALQVGGYGREDKDATDDYRFVENWIKGGKKIDFDPSSPVTLHRVLSDSMMVKFRGYKKEWAEK